MVKYRPHRRTLDEAMSEMQQFTSVQDMFESIAKDCPLFDKEDLSITEDMGKDSRIDWKECRYVCTRRMGAEKYDIPQCIGMCSIEML